MVVTIISSLRWWSTFTINDSDDDDDDDDRDAKSNLNSTDAKFAPQKLASNLPFFKGILHQKIFYRLNLIFWIVMGCGIAGAPLETPWRRESRSLVAPRVEVPGDKTKTQKC